MFHSGLYTGLESLRQGGLKSPSLVLVSKFDHNFFGIVGFEPLIT